MSHKFLLLLIAVAALSLTACPGGGDGGSDGGSLGTTAPPFLYVANSGSANVSGFSIGAGGFLNSSSPATFPTGGTTPNWIAVSPNGQFVYVSNSGTNDVSSFTVNQSNAALTATTPPAISTGPGSVPRGITVTPNGQLLYVADNGTAAV